MRYICRTQGRLPGMVMRLMTGSCLGGASLVPGLLLLGRDYDLFIVLIIVRSCMERCSHSCGEL